ncbi:MAG: transposase [Spirochaetes bacterium]|nr:transposase [Spirochaetota bacterium]
MPRAKRYFDSGLIWHITHRCHKKEFLLKFTRDKKRYLAWLYQAKKRYGLIILNYMVTSNHIHLLVVNKTECLRNVIPRSIQLIAGRTGQEFNQRKNRKGAFWEDRYHVTVVDSDDHLNQCMTYIDMNMVRAGVITHPKEWVYCGYSELLNNKKRYTILAVQSLLQLFSLKNLDDLVEHRQQAVESAISRNQYLVREAKWTESVAVGRPSFLQRIKKEGGNKSRGRRIEKEGNFFILREENLGFLTNLILPSKKNSKT